MVFEVSVFSKDESSVCVSGFWFGLCVTHSPEFEPSMRPSSFRSSVRYDRRLSNTSSWLAADSAARAVSNRRVPQDDRPFLAEGPNHAEG
jgi:hypothetical protein